jgi:shikimate kinase
MSIILIGYRASGKTSIGLKLADQLAMTFIDGDDETRRHFGNKTIAQIWDQDGQGEFRRIEIPVTTHLCTLSNHIIALGGGAPIHPDAQNAIKESPARCIYLACDPRTLHDRIHADTNTPDSRPKLTSHAGNLDEIIQTLADRDPIYRSLADLSLDVTHLTIAQAVDKVIQCTE